MFNREKDKRRAKWGCGSIAMVALFLCAIVFVLPQLSFGGSDNDRDNDVVWDDDASAQNVRAANLGPVVIAESIDRDGCAVRTATSLRVTDEFYVVAEDSEIEAGTDIFVRLYQDGVAVEDLPLITADRDYDNTCINFIIETTDGYAFDRGEYEAEFWVNGNAYDSVRFTIE